MVDTKTKTHLNPPCKGGLVNNSAPNIALPHREGKGGSPYFTCLGRGHGAPAVPSTQADWEKMRNAPWLADMCRRIAQGEEGLKAQLPIWTPGCAEFKNNHRAIADAVKPLNRLMLDFDQKGHSQEILERSLQLQAEGKWKVLLVEESVR